MVKEDQIKLFTLDFDYTKNLFGCEKFFKNSIANYSSNQISNYFFNLVLFNVSIYFVLSLLKNIFLDLHSTSICLKDN